MKSETNSPDAITTLEAVRDAFSGQLEPKSTWKLVYRNEAAVEIVTPIQVALGEIASLGTDKSTVVTSGLKYLFDGINNGITMHEKNLSSLPITPIVEAVQTFVIGGGKSADYNLKIRPVKKSDLNASIESLRAGYDPAQFKARSQATLHRDQLTQAIGLLSANRQKMPQTIALLQNMSEIYQSQLPKKQIPISTEHKSSNRQEVLFTAMEYSEALKIAIQNNELGRDDHQGNINSQDLTIIQSGLPELFELQDKEKVRLAGDRIMALDEDPSYLKMVQSLADQVSIETLRRADLLKIEADPQGDLSRVIRAIHSAIQTLDVSGGKNAYDAYLRGIQGKKRITDPTLKNVHMLMMRLSHREPIADHQNAINMLRQLSATYLATLYV